jgi:hypothetical protein
VQQKLTLMKAEQIEARTGAGDVTGSRLVENSKT